MYHVEPFSSPLTFKVADITVTKASVSDMDNNTYLLVPDEGSALLIDAADSPDLLKKLIGENKLGHILTTHRHHDHLQALKASQTPATPRSSRVKTTLTPSRTKPASSASPSGTTITL